MEKGYEYEEDLRINPDDLDGEWVKQAALYVYWSTKYAEALAEKSKIDLKRKIYLKVMPEHKKHQV